MGHVPDAPRVRLSVLGVVVVSLFAALFGRLWYLQVAAAPEFRQELTANQLRTVQIPPQRGRIVDVEGRVLVDNRRTLVVTIERDEINTADERTAMFARLSGALEVPAGELEDRYDSGVDDRYLPFPLKENVSEATANYLKERREDFPGVEVIESWQRVYRYGPIGANVVGYMERISEDNAKEYLEKGYEVSDRVGAAGIERYYEAELRGTPGSITYEVDARERIVRIVDEEPAVPGNDIQLTVDITVQQLAEQTLEKALQERRTARPEPTKSAITGEITRIWDLYPAPSGSVVIEDPATGNLLALASNPPFDPRWFEIGISAEQYAAIFGEQAGSPLFDRATQGQYAPASTFKPFVAYAGLRTGALPDPFWSMDDRGTYTVPPPDCEATAEDCTFQNAGGFPAGIVDTPRALTVSSDVFFYRLGHALWTQEGEDLLQGGVSEWGFGELTGVQLPRESQGLVPNEETRVEACEENPEAFTACDFFIGDNVQLAIGQGDVLATPLQMANAYSALANDGTIWRPNVVRAILAPGTPDVAPPPEPECPPPADPAAPAAEEPATEEPPVDTAPPAPTDPGAPDTTSPPEAPTAEGCPPADPTAPVDTSAPADTAPPDDSGAPADTSASADTAADPTATTVAAPGPPTPTRIRQVDLSQATVVRTIEPAALGRVDMPAEWRNPMLDGLRGVISGGGTAEATFAGWNHDELPLAGKTGTAQDVSKDNNKDSSLFTAFGPLYQDRQYTITAVLEQSGFGADAAAPVVRRMYEALFGLFPLPEPQDYAPLSADQAVAGVLPPSDAPVIVATGGRD